MTEMIGRRLDNYRIDRLIGQGGMGTVYQATDMNLNRSVAVKIMHPHLATNAQFQGRFLQEARAEARLEHPGIVRVYHFGLYEQQLFLVQEFVPGGSLRDYLYRLYRERKYIDLQEALELVRQIAEALHFAHLQGVIHRDVKPDNVLLRPLTAGSASGMIFQAQLTDFGLAKLAESVSYSISGQPMGTYPYMSPEQCEAGPVDGRSDIYALGVMLFELVVGRLPYEPHTISEALKMHTREPLPDPLALRPGLPAQLAPIIDQSLAKKPEERYQNAGDMARALREIQSAVSSGQTAISAALATHADSLVTYLMSQPIAAEMPDHTQPELIMDDVSGDFLTVVREGQPSQIVALSKPVMQIGRTFQDNDVALGGEKVSRQHATIRRAVDGSYTIVDLGSTNGTWLDESRLIANAPVKWEYGHTVRIGDCWLTLQQGNVRSKTQEFRVAEAIPAPRFTPPGQSGLTVPESSSPRVAVAMNPMTFQIEPGTSVDMQVEILNQGKVIDHLSLSVADLPQGWATVPAEAWQIPPGGRQMVTVKFHPPRKPATAAGQHPFKLSVHSQNDAAQAASAVGTLNVAAFSQFSLQLQPTRLEGRTATTLKISNEGNAASTFTVSARNQDNALEFRISPGQASIEPGQSRDVSIQVSLNPSFAGGMFKQFPFQVAVKVAGGAEQSASGEFVVRTPVYKPPPPAAQRKGGGFGAILKWLVILVVIGLGGAGVALIISGGGRPTPIPPGPGPVSPTDTPIPRFSFRDFNSVSLTIWVPSGTLSSVWSHIDEFQRGTGAQATAQELPWPEFSQKLRVSITAGSPPDMAIGSNLSSFMRDQGLNDVVSRSTTINGVDVISLTGTRNQAAADHLVDYFDWLLRH